MPRSRAAGAPWPTSTCATRRPAAARAIRRVYREVVERVRAADVDVVIDLTAGMGGDLVLGGADSPLPLDGAGTDLVGEPRAARPHRGAPSEICTLDCGSMNFAAGGDYVMVNTPEMLGAMARHVRELGVRPELEVFDTAASSW